MSFFPLQHKGVDVQADVEDYADEMKRMADSEASSSVGRDPFDVEEPDGSSQSRSDNCVCLCTCVCVYTHICVCMEVSWT